MGRLIVLAGSGMMLCTSRSMRAGGHAASVEAALGDGLCLVFERVQPHVQDSQVDEALALALELRVDAIVGLG
ncbi:MAG TPA: iron-containing alcohol dehydrogenase, partial [Anaerolineaceae bacterium]